ncbi:hypothetical protein AOX55_00003082 [Sinorhizobium fredii CCBAU 25509]|nr:hypothetical protein SF83666_c28720 [Sinorhizobium fredii CCBAU 83666]AWM26323.1 hypothetical protein AOX55_00003082 [Sinorhizobium fredii CCBAU 25509]
MGFHVELGRSPKRGDRQTPGRNGAAEAAIRGKMDSDAISLKRTRCQKRS